MMKHPVLVVALALFASIGVATQDGRPQLQAAAAALGATSLQTIQFSGWGSDFIFGQPYDGNAPWPRFHLPAYSVTIDYAAPGLRDDRRRAQAEDPPLGGGFQPVIGELRQVWVMSNGFAWDMVGAAAMPAALERDLRTAVDGRMAQIWLTPHGFIKAAMAGTAATRIEQIGGARKTLVSVTTPTGVKLEGTLNDQNLVERIETPLSHPMVGDTLFEAEFHNYKDFGGVKFPTRVVQRNGGYPVLDVTITDVKVNIPVSFEVPENIRAARAPAPAPLVPEKASDGVWIIPGAAKSVAVEFRDHVVIVDAPESEARSIAVMDAVARAVPSKPIRYVINTHSHFDHASGLRTYAAEGAIVVTHRDNIPYYEQLWAQPRTLSPDRLSRSSRKAVFEGVVGARTFSDGARRMVVYHYSGNMHNPGMLMVYLPKEKILMQADSYTPPANPDEAPGGMANLVHFYDAVQRLRLDVGQIIPMHGRLVTLEDARAAVERFGTK